MAAMAEKLEVSLRLINALKQENETFKDSIQQMKESQANQSAHIESLEQQREAIQQENLSLHKQLSELTAACKTQVDSKNAEIQKLKAAPLSKAELDVLRLQFQTEAEKKYAVRVGQHASEVEGLKSLVFKLRRENELLREDNARQSRNFAADLKKAKKAHVEEIASFEERVKELQSCIDSLSDTDRVRQLQRQNADLHLKIQGLTEELEEQRCRRESLRVEMEQKERLSQRRLIEEGAALKCATMERDSFAAKSQALQEELRQKARLQDELSEENARLKKEVLRAQSQAEEVAHRSTVKANEIKAAVLKKEQMVDASSSELKKRLIDAEINLKTSGETVAELRQRILVMEKDYLDRVRSIREEEAENASAVNAEKAKLSHQISELNKLIAEMRQNQDGYQKSAAAELSTLKSTARTLTDLNDALLREKETLLTDKERLAADLQAALNKLDDHARAAALAARERADGERAERDARERLAEAEQQLQQCRADLCVREETLEREAEAFRHNLEMSRAVWAKDREAMKSQIQSIGDEVARLAAAECEARKLAHTAADAARRDRRRAARLKRDRDALRAEIDARARAERDALAEMQRRRSAFVALLAEEGGGGGGAAAKG